VAPVFTEQPGAPRQRSRRGAGTLPRNTRSASGCIGARNPGWSIGPTGRLRRRDLTSRKQL